ncbi:hypothetical protein GGF42_001278 [Coemansia sp. RSA 2424]|nr:hypothetical protein GGF42_001278 [Coemansia sp. RSA 2424]
MTIEWDILADDGTACTQRMPLDIGRSVEAAMVMRRVLDKAENARIALCAMSSQQPGDMLPTSIEFVLPPQPVRVFVLGGLAALAALALAPSGNILGMLVYWLLPQRVFQLALYTLAAVHFVEAVVMYLACCHVQRLTREYELSASIRMQYTLSTLMFGVFAGIMFLRQAVKPPRYHVKEKTT